MKATAIIAYLLVVVAGIIGWVLNLIHTIGYIDSTGGDSTFEVAARVTGIFVPFIGAILGYV